MGPDIASAESDELELDAAYAQAHALGLIDEASFDRITDTIATNACTMIEALNQLQTLMVNATACPLLALPTELLPTITRSLSERDAFASLGATCKLMASTTTTADFFNDRLLNMPLAETHARALGREARAYVVGCVKIPRDSDEPGLFGTLNSLPKARSPAESEYRKSGGLDLSRGQERHPLTVRMQLCESQTFPRRLFGEPPDNHCNAFEYVAGPISAPVPLQIFRSGMPRGLGYGLRTLAAVRSNSLVTTYWGEYTFGGWSEGRLQRMYTRKTGATEMMTYALQVHHEGHVFWIDPLRTGNAAKYVNHSAGRANVEIRYVPSESPLEAGSLGLITDLVGRPDLNGRLVTLLAYDDGRGRWKCRRRRPLPDDSTLAGRLEQRDSAEVVLIRPRNVVRIAQAAAPLPRWYKTAVPKGLPVEFCGGVPLVGLYATRELELGEEVLLDYTFTHAVLPEKQCDHQVCLVLLL